MNFFSLLPRGPALDYLTLSDACVLTSIPLASPADLDWRSFLAQDRVKLGRAMSETAKKIQRKVKRQKIDKIETSESGIKISNNKNISDRQNLCGVPINPHWANNSKSNFHRRILPLARQIDANYDPETVGDFWFLATEKCQKLQDGKILVDNSLKTLEENSESQIVDSFHSLNSMLAKHVKLLEEMENSEFDDFDVEHRMIEPMEITNTNFNNHQITANNSQTQSSSSLSSASTTNNNQTNIKSEYSNFSSSHPSASSAPPLAPPGPVVRRGFQSIMKVSESLSSLLGHRYLKRSSAVRLLWSYCKVNQLQSKIDGKQINCDEKLSELMGGMKTISFNQMLSLITAHLTPVNRASSEYKLAEREADRVSEELLADDKQKGIKRRTHKRKKNSQKNPNNTNNSSSATTTTTTTTEKTKIRSLAARPNLGNSVKRGRGRPKKDSLPSMSAPADSKSSRSSFDSRVNETKEFDFKSEDRNENSNSETESESGEETGGEESDQSDETESDNSSQAGE